MKPTPEQIDAAAEAIANVRGMRRGVPPIVGVLRMLPDHVLAAVREDAEAALKTVGEVTVEPR